MLTIFNLYFNVSPLILALDVVILERHNKYKALPRLCDILILIGFNDDVYSPYSLSQHLR